MPWDGCRILRTSPEKRACMRGQTLLCHKVLVFSGISRDVSVAPIPNVKRQQHDGNKTILSGKRKRRRHQVYVDIQLPNCFVISFAVRRQWILYLCRVGRKVNLLYWVDSWSCFELMKPCLEYESRWCISWPKLLCQPWRDMRALPGCHGAARHMNKWVSSLVGSWNIVL